MKIAGLFISLMFVATAPAQPATAPSADHLLGPVFESPSAGIALRGPAGAKQFRRPGSDDIIQFVNEDKKWNLSVARAQLNNPLALANSKDQKGEPVTGLLETTVKQIEIDKPGAQILRSDIVSFADTTVGMIAAKYALGLESYLMQQALVRVTDRHYFVLTLVSPAPRAGEIDQDPGAREAVETFSAVLDSMRLLDQSAIKEDQSQRLFRTRTLFLSIGEQRLRGALVPAQWLRIIENGKDIGYVYVIEEVARDLPRKNTRPERQGGTEGVLVGIRSRTMKEGVWVDSEAWQFCTFDRRNESWSTTAQIDDPKAGRNVLREGGVTVRRTKPVPDQGSVLKDGNKGITFADEYVLSVTQFGDKTANVEPTRRDLPVFYLPQALGHLLPRIVPRNEPKTYMFASYVGEKREVMARYVDVGREEQVTLGGQTMRAVPVRDRIGLEGSVTTHFVSTDGVYLGSINNDSRITVLPTDGKTLEKLWKDANLTRPGAVEEK